MTAELELWSPEQVDTLRRTYLRGMPDAELRLFAEVCGHLGLSPFRDEITAVPRRVGTSTVWRHQVQVQGRRKLAADTGELRGYRAEWCGPHSPDADSPLQWVEVWLSDAPPHAARVTVWRNGWRPEGVSAVWPWRESIKFHARNASGVTVGPWADMPSHMLAKVAESKALRLAFPDVITAEVAGEWDDESVEGSPARHRAGGASSEEVGTAPSPRSASPDAAVPMMTADQATELSDLFGTLGLAGEARRAARMTYIADALGREVDSARTVTAAEADVLLATARGSVRKLAEPEPEPEPEPEVIDVEEGEPL